MHACVMSYNVIRFPSIPKCFAGVTVKASLLDFQPEEYGLPPFKDTVQGTIPLVNVDLA